MKSLLLGSLLAFATTASASWTQLQGDAGRSGNAPDVVLPKKLGLVASVPLTDAVFAAPVTDGKSVFVVDGSGVVFAIDAKTHQVRWRFATQGGSGNCNNVAAPAVAGRYLHVGTTAGYYYVFNKNNGKVVNEIDCREPIFSAPAVGKKRVYFATLGAQIYAVEPDGELAWKWDFVKEVVGFTGDRWLGADWVKFRGDRVNWKDHFVCSRDISLVGDTVVMPAGGRTVFVKDNGDGPKLRKIGEIPSYAGKEYPATFGQSADAEGKVYIQWHRRDNAGRVDILRLEGDELKTDFVKGTGTYINTPDLLSFSSVAIRDGSVFRTRPQHGRGLCLHTKDSEEPKVLCDEPSIAPPTVTRDHVVYGGLNSKLYVVPIKGGKATALDTSFGAPITAPVAVSTGRIYAACEDGYLYVYGANGKATLPKKDLGVTRVRSPIKGPKAGDDFNWYSNYGDFQGSNANDQDLKPPLRMRWARRLEGTVKHLPVCGGGRMYMHTAEGQIIAVEQDTGRLVWRRHWPHVHLSFTSPLYHEGKLLIPQGGL
ncbi:MAG: PQQ-binding-like beta-propeller repeat protein, partial [Limisphaerales bacterium]